jgi:septum formation protein
LEKARSGLGHAGDGGQAPTLGADTAVVVDDRVLGKPGDRDQAFAMLKLLSGRMHRVLTAVALVGRGRASHALQESQVTFRHLTSEECRHYVSTGESLDKAGGYGIQGYAAAFVEHLEGSYSGVMGLPLFETWRLIVEFGIDVEWK